jgi:mono/diheme cytochrome c family protein
MANCTAAGTALRRGSRQVSRTTVCTIALLSAATSLATAQAAAKPMDREPKTAGQALYLKYCASCHGAEGEGQSNWQKPNELGELPAPPHNAEGHTWRHSDSELFRMIADGWRDPFNRTKRLTMPPFKEILAEQEIADVITYLKTLWSAEQQQFQHEETSSQAMSTPGQQTGEPSKTPEKE